MTINRNCMTKADAVVIAAIEAGVPSLIEARALVDQFHDMIRKKGGLSEPEEAASTRAISSRVDRRGVRTPIDIVTS